MFHNISNPKWFGKWSRLEDDYLYNDGTDTSGNFVFSKMEKTGGLFGSIISLATAFPACSTPGHSMTPHGSKPSASFYCVCVSRRTITHGYCAPTPSPP